MPNVRRCAIVGCESHSKRNPDLSFFRFPHQDSPYYEQWRKACHASLSRILPFKMAYICTLHFDRGVISGRRLSGQAVPTRFLDVPAYYTADDRITITAENERERRIAYINGVVYEWLLRANRNPELTGAITHGMIKEKAEMAKQIIQCDSFVADNRWLNYFRATHLRDFSKKAAEAKPLGSSLSIPDIVKALQFRFPISNATAEDDDDDDMDGDDDDGEGDGDTLDGGADGLDGDGDMDGVDAEIDGADADGDESLNEYGESKENSAPPTPSVEQFSQDPLGSIKLKTYKQALDYLKTLEDFAVKKENFRVISIVSQLETLLRKGDRIVNLEVVD